MNINKNIAYGIAGAGAAVSLTGGGIAMALSDGSRENDRKEMFKTMSKSYKEDKDDAHLKIGLITAAGVVASGATGLGIAHFCK